MPYGEDRTTTPTGWKGTKGYVGGTKDPSGLTHLSAREYDPTTGRFISVDPVMDLIDPQQWNAYTYSNNNPVTYSDPSGLFKVPPGADGGGGSGAAPAAAMAAAALAATRAVTTRIFVAAGMNPFLARILAAIVVTASHMEEPQVGVPTSEPAHNSRFARHEDDDRGRLDFSPKSTRIIVSPGQYLWTDGTIRNADGSMIYKQAPFGKEDATGLDQLALFRQQLGLGPHQGSGDTTLGRLDIGGETFYGINGHGRPITLEGINAFTKTHAEADAFQQAYDAGVKAESAVW